MAPAELSTDAAALRVELCYSPEPGVMHRCTVELPPGSQLRDALRASNWVEQFGWQWPLKDDGSFEPGGLRAGVWGKLRPLGHGLRDRDRVEVYRGLKVDPKEARRLRYKAQPPSL